MDLVPRLRIGGVVFADAMGRDSIEVVREFALPYLARAAAIAKEAGVPKDAGPGLISFA